MKAISLFANIGVAEAYLKEIGVDVILANEINKRRADLYSKIYPESKMVLGDINEEKIHNILVNEAISHKIDIVMATPPCQGMSTAGTKDKDDKRNKLIIPVINFIKKVKPRYIFIENVKAFIDTEIKYGYEQVRIIDLIHNELGTEYFISKNIIDTKDYAVPQTRERVIILMTRNDQPKVWEMPEKESQIITMSDAIGDLPTIDPFIKDVSEEELLKIFPLYYERAREALKISKWNNPPQHIKRQVEVMVYTPTGYSAFNNEYYIPRKANGEPVKGYNNTYKRQNWDTPAYTVTMDNRKISSQNNVHPGRYIGENENGEPIYSDARALTVYELMRIMSLPSDWNIPDNTSEAFLRSVIGEGIPPMFVKKVFEKLVR